MAAHLTKGQRVHEVDIDMPPAGRLAVHLANPIRHEAIKAYVKHRDAFWVRLPSSPSTLPS